MTTSAWHVHCYYYYYYYYYAIIVLINSVCTESAEKAVFRALSFASALCPHGVCIQ